MPVEIVPVRLDSSRIFEVQIAYLCRSDRPCAYDYIRPYFQGLRNGSLAGISGGYPEQTGCARNYHAMEEQYARQLERELPTETFEAILSPPSRYDHAAVYRDAFIAALRARRELKDRFHKDGTSRSGEGADLAEIIGELKYEAHGDEASLRSVLIVDDTLGTGNTVSAVITRLLDAGVPASCRFAVAVPFWAKPL